MWSLYISLFILNLVLKAYGTGEDHYYWKEFTGQIPSDAFEAGRTASGSPVYIAQTYQHQKGLYIGTVYKNIIQVEYSGYGGPQTTSFDVKIFCTRHPHYFKWIKTNNKSYQKDLAGLTVVGGGFDALNPIGSLKIGRLFYQGDDIIGEIYPVKDNAQIWFAYRKTHRAANYYEVLTVDSSRKPPLNPRDSH